MSQRPPRILGWRLGLVGPLLGLVLSVLSVPVCARLNPPPFGHVPSGGWGPTALHLDEPWVMWISSPKGLGGRAWSTHARLADSPFMDEGTLRRAREQAPTRDPRPARARVMLFEGDNTTRHVEHGFPLPAAFARRGMSMGQRNFLRDDGWLEWSLLGKAFATPMRPLWSGLVMNAMVYAGLVLGLVVLARVLRRARRRRRNRCVACGYDMAGGAGVCPECGCVDRRAFAVAPSGE